MNHLALRESVEHPGTVDTDVQSTWTETFGFLGKLLDKGTRFFGKTAPEGAEASLWGATSTDIFEGNWKDYQVRGSDDPICAQP